MSSVTRHKCFLCLDTVSTGKINRPYYKVHLENIHNVSCNTEKLLNWLIEQRPAPKPASSSRGRPASTLSSVANLMGMSGITITKDSSHSRSATIPETLINIKGITVQKVSNDDIEILEDEVQDVQYEEYDQQQPQYVQQTNQQQPIQYSNYGYPQPVRGRGMVHRHSMQPVTGGRGGNMMMQNTRGRGIQMPVRGVRGGMATRGRGGGHMMPQQNNILKQQEAAIEKWANSCEHGCRICKREGKSFTTLVRQNLVKHLDTVHNIAEKDYKAEFKVQSLITRASNIVCTLCNNKVKRLPVSLSTHMKKHKMTIRQYWMKYVAPQGSPLATFQPRSMGGPVLRGGGHPAMRGMSPGRGGVMVPSRGGMTPSRGMRGRGMMRGMMSGMPMARNDLVIGEVFSVNGGEATAGSQLQSEIEIDNKNVLLQSLNDSGEYSSMEVECDPLSMLDTSQESETEDSKDFFIDGVPVKADPDSVNTEYYETNPNIDVKPDIKPDIKKLMKDEPPDQQPEEGNQVSGEEGASQNTDTTDQDGPIFHIDSVTSEHVPSEKDTPTDDDSQTDNASFDITGEKISEATGDKEAGDSGGGEETEAVGSNEDPFCGLNDVLDVVRAQEDSHDAHEPDQPNTGDAVDPNKDQHNLDGGDDNAMDGEKEEAIMSGGGEINMAPITEDNHASSVQDTNSANEFVALATDSSTQIPSTWQQQPEQNYWYSQPCPYVTPGCPLYCCHVRATQEVREGTTDWNMPYGPPADGGVPCSCCINDSGGE